MDSDLSPTNRMGKTVSTEMDERTFGIFKRYKRKTSLVLSLKTAVVTFLSTSWAVVPQKLDRIDLIWFWVLCINDSVCPCFMHNSPQW